PDRDVNTHLLVTGEAASIHLDVDRRVLPRLQATNGRRDGHAATGSPRGADVQGDGVDVGDLETMEKLGAPGNVAEVVRQAFLKHFVRPAYLGRRRRGQREQGS